MSPRLRLIPALTRMNESLRADNDALREMLRQERTSAASSERDRLRMERDAYRDALSDLVEAVREKRWAGGSVRDALRVADDLLDADRRAGCESG